MAAIFMSSSAEKPFSPYKQLRNVPKSNMGANFVPKSNENLVPTNTLNGTGGGGFMFAPPLFLSFSYPPSTALHNPIFYPNHQQMQQQPPLLPLPTPDNPLPSRTRSLSSSPSNGKNNNKARDQSLTPKRSKSKQPIICGRVEDQPNKDHLKPTEATKTQAMIKPSVMASVNPIGPDPNDLPRVLASSYVATGNVAKDLEKFSGSVFTLSPPPSSLPFPKFSLRPKLSCIAEAAEVDIGATDNLRRLLRLR
ncbi:putative TFIIB zinc-binding protein [Hibiscus syriacus]|uniref:TFIIB zinc-binding protein n=1 Tax=Hibiscus syriacus TaxID=106335 RepID=A0A6A3BG00_HIBSY|nr:putative TFIIB zinc-binding protein [Hibiscus syriacus]